MALPLFAIKRATQHIPAFQISPLTRLIHSSISLLQESSNAPPLNIAVVGSGPAGFYTVDKILKRFPPNTHTTVIDALPTPFGLVRSGVAPDHPDTKNVIHQFTKLAKDPRVTFLGNVRVGNPEKNEGIVSLAELQSAFHAVVLCYGAESDKRLHIPGEDDYRNIFSAREFVWWYNGHPEMTKLPVDLRTIASVAICGLGNVAVDCARILLSPMDTIAQTDISSHALQVLRESSVKDVHLIGRRGPAQAACTPKELRELLALEKVGVKIWPEGCLENLGEACLKEIKASRIKRRVVEVLGKLLHEKAAADIEKTLHIHFLQSPVEFLGIDEGNNPNALNNVGAVRVEHTKLQSINGTTNQIAVKTGETSLIPAQLVLESIGYRSFRIEGAPFDEKKGIIPNVLGQVIDPTVKEQPTDGEESAPTVGGTALIPGLFVCGWLKRGPTGIIGTNLVDAEQTVDTMVRNMQTFHATSHPASKEESPVENIQSLVEKRGGTPIRFDEWEKIDAEEIRRGTKLGKPRDKIVDVEEMVKIAKS